ncbi:hypothetical protein AURDEDRAFT_112249, partial [Auricularia subglabra TFB-10046 SS5]
MRSVVAFKNRASESAGNVRDRWVSPSSSKLNLPDPYQSRKAGAVQALHQRQADLAGEEYTEEPEDVHVDWANLSPEDKEVFFSWLDEFFARAPGSSHQAAPGPPPPPHARAKPGPPVAPRRPPLPESSSTTDTAPTTKSRFMPPPGPPPVANKPPPPPVAPKPPKPSLQNRQTEPQHAPPPVAWNNRPPPVNLRNKPARPASATPAVVQPEFDFDDDDDWCTAHRDFSEADAHAALFPREHAESIQQLGYDLTAPFDDEVDKARALFTWMHHNIAYDAANFLAGTVRPMTVDDTLRTGMAVCEGYSGLFAALALAAGLEVITVHGHGKGYGYEPPPPGSGVRDIPRYEGNHAWNAVKLDGDWRLMDSTWGAGALTNGAYLKRFAPIHFCGAAGPGHNREFGRRHYPSERTHQFVPRHMQLGWEEYMLMPERPRVTGDFGEYGYSEILLQPDTKYILPGRHTVVLKRYCRHVQDTEDDSYVPIILVKDPSGRDHPQSMQPLVLHPDYRVGWTVEVDVNSGQTLQLAIVKVIGGQDATGYGRAAYERARGRQGMSWSYLVEWEVQ